MATKTNGGAKTPTPDAGTAGREAAVELPSFGNLIQTSRELVQKVRDNITQLLKVREELVSAKGHVDEQLAELRTLIGENTEVEDDPPRRGRPANATRKFGGGNRRGGKTLEELCYDALKKAGKTGLSKRGVAAVLLEGGFDTPSTEEQFAKSCYVSGIHKLLTREWAEHFAVQGEREGRYRLTAEGLARKGE